MLTYQLRKKVYIVSIEFDIQVLFSGHTTDGGYTKKRSQRQSHSRWWMVDRYFRFLDHQKKLLTTNN